MSFDYILGLLMGRKKGTGEIDLEGGLSVTEDEDGFIVIEEAEDGE